MKKKPKGNTLNAAQIAMMEPKPFGEAFAYMRNKKTGEILKNLANGEPLYKRPKREWSFDGVHQVYFDDGTYEERPGRYIIKQERQ